MIHILLFFLLQAKSAEDFYQSFGLPAMTDTFWQKSVLSRRNTDTRCHGAAADMFKDGDFRSVDIQLIRLTFISYIIIEIKAIL